MDKSTLVKLVWLGAISAIPIAIVALQKPEASRVVETHRVITVDQPVAVESGGEVQGPKPAESAAPVDPPKPRMVVMGGAKITSKVTADSPPAPEEPHAVPKLNQDPGLTAAVTQDGVGAKR